MKLLCSLFIIFFTGFSFALDSIKSVAISITPPEPAVGTVLTSFKFPVISLTGESFHLNIDQVILNGPGSVGCKKSITGTGMPMGMIHVSGCTETGPLTVSIGECSAGIMCATMAGSSSAAMVSNSTLDLPVSEILTYTYPGESADISYELYFPTNWEKMSNLPLYIHIHGGSWMGGSAADDAEWARAIAKKGFIVANLNYTLAKAPDLAPYTVGENDIFSFVKFATNPAVLKSIHADPKKVSIGGASAGGHLALFAATRSDNNYHYNCVVDIAGPTNLLSIKEQATLPITGQIVDFIWGENPSSYYSPALNTNHFKAKKLLIVHATLDNLVPIAQAYEMEKNIRRDKPEVELTLNYWTKPIKDPNVPDHNLFGPEFILGMTNYLSSQCGGYIDRFPASNVLTLGRVEAKAELAGWDATRVLDQNDLTSYSSPRSDLNNSARHYLAGWFNQSQKIEKLIIKARMKEQTPLGFPESYEVFLTNPANTKWVSQGIYSLKPNSDGEVIISFAKKTTTSGVMIVPKKLGKDDYGNYYFQIAELSLE